LDTTRLCRFASESANNEVKLLSSNRMGVLKFFTGIQKYRTLIEILKLMSGMRGRTSSRIFISRRHIVPNLLSKSEVIRTALLKINWALPNQTFEFFKKFGVHHQILAFLFLIKSVVMMAQSISSSFSGDFLLVEV